MDMHCLVFALSCFGIFLFKKWGSCFLKVKSQNSFCQVGRFARKTFCQDRLRHFVRKTFCQDRPALDVLSGRHFVRTGLDVLSGPKYLATIWTILLRYLGNTWAPIESYLNKQYLSGTWALLGRYLGTTFGNYLNNTLAILRDKVVTTWGLLGHYLINTWAILRDNLATTWPILGLLGWYLGKTSAILWY